MVQAGRQRQMRPLPQVMLNRRAAGILAAPLSTHGDCHASSFDGFHSPPLALGLPLLAAAQRHDIDKINGSVQVEAGQQAGDVSTVNGSVHIGRRRRRAQGQHGQRLDRSGRQGPGQRAQYGQRRDYPGRGSRVSGEVTAVNGACIWRRAPTSAASWATSTARSRWTPRMSPAVSKRSAATSRSAPTRTSKAASWSTSPAAGSTGTAAIR
jgi:hypothetical protein